MKTLHDVNENLILSAWRRDLRDHPMQLNRIHEADAELIRVSPDLVVAVTIDSIVEEIRSGMYDARSAGWVGVVAALSDLAAVGAEPLGLTVSATLPAGSRAAAVQAELASGVAAACAATCTHVVGGDTGFADELSLVVQATGLIRERDPVTRMGCEIGDRVFVSAAMGLGAPAAAALVPRLRGLRAPPYRPMPRVAEGLEISRHATCCMDSSDGFVATLDQLSRLNNVGFAIDLPPERIVRNDVIAWCRAASIDPLIPLLQPHGEYELVFTLPASIDPDRISWPGAAPIGVGRVTEGEGVRFTHLSDATLDGAALRNGLAGQTDAHGMLATLQRVAASLRHE